MPSIPRRGRARPCDLLAALLLAVCLALAGCSDDGADIAPLAERAVIVAFGDSLTRGVGAGQGEDYPSRLSALSGRAVINAGVPGETSDKGLARLPAILERHHPGLVILWHGGNDILRNRNVRETEQNLRAMVTRIRDAGAQVLLVAVPEKSLLLGAAAFYRRIAEDMKVAFLEDVLGDVLRSRALKTDAVHPNGDGYRLVAEKIFSAIR